MSYINHESECRQRLGEDGNHAGKPSLQRIAEQIVGPVEWLSPTEGNCQCPGQHLHTTASTRCCRVYLAGVPTIHCFHGHCTREVAKANNTLRRAARGITGEVQVNHDKLRQMREAQRKRCELEGRARESFPNILKQYRWTCQDMFRESPVSTSVSACEQARMALSLYNPDDTVWIGSKYDSGSEEDTRQFRTAREWMGHDTVWIYDQISPYVFRSGVYSRTKDNIVGQRFLAVESDELGLDEVGAVFKWLQDTVGLNLRLVVHTGGKSLHAWFDVPPSAVKEQLEVILPQYKCDPAMFRTGQITRLPGGYRRDNGRAQDTIYFSGRAS